MELAASSDGRFTDVEAQVRRADGGARRLVCSGYTDSGRWLLSARDITQRQRTFEKISLQAQLLDAVDAAVIASDPDGSIIEWSAGAEQMLGWSREKAVGDLAMTELLAFQDADQMAQIVQTLRRDGRWEGELDVRRKDGTTLPALVRSALYHTEGGDPAGFVGVAVDLTEQVHARRNLEAAHDHLRAITESMGEALFTVGETGDLRYMNRAAEELLGWTREEAIGRSTHELVHFRRPDGTPYPAEETPLVRALDSGEAVRVDDGLFIRKDGGEVPVAYSAAPSKGEDGGHDLVVVVRDITERKAKERELTERIESMSWVGRIRDALAEDRFRVYAQPIVDLKSGETREHELLIRMLGQDGSIILPGEFLPAAEEYLVMRDIDDWMVAQAAHLAAEGHAVSVNLSAQSVVAEDMFDQIRAELDRAGADPRLVSIEITETAFLADKRAARRFLEQLEALGCSVALDDFGTGYGGFSHLKRLPVDCLKIDQEFVQDLATDGASHRVVEAIVSLAKGFGQFTIAEGAEDEATRQELRKLDVDCVQGFVVAKPRPVDEVFAESHLLE
jgi:PAS domain S-box-containing protein